MALALILFIVAALVGLLLTHPLRGAVIWFTDRPIADLMASVHTTAGHNFMEDHVSKLGTDQPCLIVGIVAGLIFSFVRRTLRPLMLFLLAGGGAYALTVATKVVVDRPGPGAYEVSLLNSSFPSGHTIAATAVYGMLAIIMASLCGKVWRIVVWSVTAAVIGAVALSRLYLAVHWFTDVLGGVALGGAWIWGLWHLIGWPAGATGGDPPTQRWTSH